MTVKVLMPYYDLFFSANLSILRAVVDLVPCNDRKALMFCEDRKANMIKVCTVRRMCPSSKTTSCHQNL